MNELHMTKVFIIALACLLKTAVSMASDISFEDIEYLPTANELTSANDIEAYDLIEVTAPATTEDSVERDFKNLYHGQRRSFIEWGKMSPDQWLDFESWRNERALKDENPDWRIVFRDQQLNSEVGRVLECLGECRRYRDLDFNRLRHRSGIYEGDEVHTIGDSYAWIYLHDGTLVRLSPDSSITFQEINIGINRIFHHARINQGQVAWIARKPHQHISSKERETDTLFYPLSLWRANWESTQEAQEQGAWVEQLDDGDGEVLKFWDQIPLPVETQINRLNRLITKNNEKMINQKDTYYFLVTPSATFEGAFLQAEIVALESGKTYFNQKKISHYSLKESQPMEEESSENESESRDVKVGLRGYESRELQTASLDTWYEVDPLGRSLGQVEDSDKLRHLQLSTLLTRRIPTILLAREIWLKRYNFLAYNINDPNALASRGYRLWEILNYGDDHKVSDLELRHRFLREYTRRLETSNLNLRREFLRNMKENSGYEYLDSYSARFYQRAYDFYVTNQYEANMRKSFHDLGRPTSHSTRRNYWLRYELLNR